VVWITGASQGIGREVAKRLADRGCRLALSARSADALAEAVQKIGAEKALAVPMDVGDRQANLDAVARIREHFGGLDIAILNAGICEFINVKRFSSTVFERTMRTNYLGVIYGIEAALPALRASKHPHLVAMSSTAGYRGLPRGEAYGASKAAVRYTLESLRIDLRREGIPVSVIYPWFVRTSMTARNDFPMPGIVSLERAARSIVNGIERQAPDIDFPKSLSLMLRLVDVLPARLYTAILDRLGNRHKS